jgi:hypothetical protein
VAVRALAVAGRPRSATAVLGVHVALGTRSLCRLGVPAPAAAGLSLRAFADSAVAVGRAMTMLAPGVAAFGLAHRRTRATTATLLLAEPLRACARSRSRSREPTRPTLDPLRFVTFALADDVAYGTGVWTGALRARTTRPLRPTRTRPSS